MGNCCCFAEFANPSNKIENSAGYVKDTTDDHEGELRLSAQKPPSEITCNEWESTDILDLPWLDASDKYLHYRTSDDVSANAWNHELSTSTLDSNFGKPSDLYFNMEIANFKDYCSGYMSDLQATADETILGTKCYCLKTVSDSKNVQTENYDIQEHPIMTWNYEQSSDQPTATEFIPNPADSEEKSWILPFSNIITIGNRGLSIGALGCELTLGSEIQLSVMGIDLLKSTNSTNNKFGLFQK